MLIAMLVSLYTTRIVLQKLGIDDFGVFNVVGGVSATFMFLNSAMSSVTQRYLSIEIGKNDEEQLRKVFNVSVVIHTFIGLVVVFICEVFGLWFIYNKMVIPEGRLDAALWAFQLSLVAIFITMISVPYNALLISRERLGAFAYISLVDVFVKLGIAYLISIVTYDKLIFYSFLITMSQILLRVMYGIYCHSNFKECRFKLYRYDPLYKEMTQFASWGLLGHFSSIVNTSLQDMLINTFFSPAINAARATAIKVSSATSGFVSNFQLSVEAQITKTYAVQNLDRTYFLIFQSSRFALYLLWFLSLPVFVCIDEILDIWLVEVPEMTSLLVRIILVGNLIQSLANPLNIAIRATGRIKLPEIIGGIILCANFPLSYLFLKLGFDAYVVFLIVIFCNVLCQVSRIVFSNLYLNMDIMKYFNIVLLKPFSVILLSSVFPIVLSKQLFVTDKIDRIIIFSLISVISTSFCFYYAGLNSTERLYIKTFIKTKIRK